MYGRPPLVYFLDADMQASIAIQYGAHQLLGICMRCSGKLMSGT